jgi:hypothetical protein
MIDFSANALITVAEFNNLLGLSISDSDALRSLINAASDYIAEHTNRCLLDTTYTSEKYDGNGEYKLFLNNFPINSITHLYEWNTVDNAAAITFYENTDYLYNQKEGWIYLSQGFTQGIQNYQVTYGAGYVKTAATGKILLPFDIRNACAQLVQVYRKFKAKPGIISETIGTYSYSRENKNKDLRINGMAIPAEIADVISRYARLI